MEKDLRQEDINLVKIVLFGPESTGKTTLSIQLAKHYNTVWVQEYARPYLQKVWNQERRTCQQKDILPIAFGQIALENRLAKRADKVLICDTDLLETKVYSSAYYGGFVDPILEKAATENTYNLYLLTYIDTPWEADDLRDRPEQRLEMFEAFQKALDEHDRPYLLLKGDKESRLKKAVEAIDAILANNTALYSYSDSLKNE
ncbi:ATP-binding protein [Flavobacteriaceae bacterium]|mgnify:FL=1|jgi:HTH-type transcriptional repressor of NAD biosynthesis genes|nr:ATP-binding protein [bacterium]MDB9927512.1 ATP-binding protein [Flavobacteriaceae bacterium]MDB9955993.1 ATP-binding protein [Flavobacteriaceae bacterium]MDC1343256.1 ATP-binding protein [Flavobacteriaceae bacterium]MDC3299355.1 ATP-binding protein [Flavobacteriaceae bacterium]